LPAQYVSHSWNHHELEPFRGRRVLVIGGGSSAIDLAGLLYDAGAEVQLVARRKSLKFHSRAVYPRPMWERIRHPESGLGPGLKSRFFSNWATVFHYLPEHYRLHAVRTHLGPSGGWFAKEKLVGRVPLMLGHTLQEVQVEKDCVRLHLRGEDGAQRQISADHVIAATGYRVDLEKLKFLSDELRSKLSKVETAPRLSSAFESSVSGLYFTGIAAANSFGPLMRFAFGARFAATRISERLKRGSRARVSVPAGNVVGAGQSLQTAPEHSEMVSGRAARCETAHVEAAK
jgi:lysine/ornithine N-monooxygenase